MNKLHKMINSPSAFPVLSSEKPSLGFSAISRTSEKRSWCKARPTTIKCENVFEWAAILEFWLLSFTCNLVPRVYSAFKIATSHRLRRRPGEFFSEVKKQFPAWRGLNSSNPDHRSIPANLFSVKCVRFFVSPGPQSLNFQRFTDGFRRLPKISEHFRKSPKIFRQLPKIAEEFPLTSGDNRRCRLFTVPYFSVRNVDR